MGKQKVDINMDELDRLRLENISLQEALRIANQTIAEFKNNLPKLAGVSAINLQKINEILHVMAIYQENYKPHLSTIRSHDCLPGIVAVDTLEFFHNKTIDLIQKAQELCTSPIVGEDVSIAIGTHLFDYIFKEFKVDSNQRILEANGKSTHIPNSEFSILIELIKRPNQEIHFDNPQIARTLVSRLKQRLPVLKNLITPVYGKTAYTLNVTRLASK